VRVGINLTLPKDAKGTYEFAMVRLMGKHILGGVTYVVRVEDEKRPEN
jgi:hypothetical protein